MLHGGRFPLNENDMCHLLWLSPVLDLQQFVFPVLRCISTCLSLAEFEGCTVSYGPSFFPILYDPSRKWTVHKSKGEKQGSVTYSMDQEDKVSSIRIIFNISLLCV